jgi:DNA-binding NtrC family response regulator
VAQSKIQMGDATPTVLIVDDEPQILRLLQKMIGPHRANILMAPRPSEALLLCERQTVDVLISDMAMPEMDGLKLAERVLKIHPNASVLLISGQYKEPPAAARAGRVRFLKKPFFPSDLVAMLEQMLA